MKKNQKLTKSKLDRNQIHPIERISKYWNVSENNHCLISKALNFPSHKDIKLLKPRIYQQNLNCTKESNQGTAFFLVSFKMKTLTVIALTVASASPYCSRNPVAEATPIKVVVSLSFKNNMIKVSYNAWNSVIQRMFIFFHFSLAKIILKGEAQGHYAIFKGLKMTFRTKILKKNYTTLISIKNTTNFVLTTFL